MYSILVWSLDFLTKIFLCETKSIEKDVCFIPAKNTVAYVEHCYDGAYIRTEAPTRRQRTPYEPCCVTFTLKDHMWKRHGEANESETMKVSIILNGM